MTIENIIFEAGSDEWFKARSGNVTATEISCLFPGIGFKSTAKLAEEKLFGAERFQNNYTRIGNMFEPAVLQGFEMATGFHTEPAAPKNHVSFWRDKKNKISCTLDGLTTDSSGQQKIFEAKTTGSSDPEKALLNFNKWKDSVPYYYLLQIQVQLMLSETDYGYICCLQYNYPVRLIAYKVTADPIIHRAIIKAVGIFWDCLENDKEYTVTKQTSFKLKDRLHKSQEFILLDEGL